MLMMQLESSRRPRYAMTRKHKARKQERLSTSETKSLRKIMREFNLDLSKINDISEALVKKNETLNVYEKKHPINESREKFRKRIVCLSLSEVDFIYADGIDCISNFYIKKLTSLHKYLSDIVKFMFLEGTPQADWYYCGLTYLIPKDTPKTGSDYRTITCISNLRKLLSDNQLGAVRGALLNVAINKEYGNNIKATWIDVKKAYDSIDKAYLTQVIENLNLPDWILKFIKGLKKIMNKDINKGILQGDSLSPLLFVLCMDSLSRKLNEKYSKGTIKTDAESHATNHLLFIDDLKLLAEDGQTLEEMTEEVKKFMNNIGLEINKEKSATNDPCCEDTATLLEGIGVYKYLGIIEDSRGIPTSKSFEEVQTKLIARVERLCRTRLNARNLFQAINQHAISLLNYHIGVLRLEPADFSKLDDAVRAVLVKNKILLRPGGKERLYLPRKELGRGLHSVEFKSEHMLLQFLDCLKKHKDTSTRRAAILKKLEEAQLANLYNEIKNRKLHSKLYSARNNELVKVFCYIHDRNVFWGAEGICHHCNRSRKTVDHLATRCEKMLGHDYTRRHNEVVRCIHLLLLNKYKSHSVQEILDNEYAEIRVDTRIKTDVKIRCNRPDIFILDKRQNRITLIEVGITSQDSLQIVETEKLRKSFYKCRIEIIPYVMTWDGIVTKYHKTYVKRLQIPMNVEAYIQSIVLKKIVETISFDRRRGLDWERASLSVIIGAEMHKQPIPPLKQVDNEEDHVKTENTKNILTLILDGITTAKEPITNTNEELELEEEIEVVEMVERII
ncbi:reverse transcriptase [Hamiltosporidium tvaerminnensis]|uniref:Reverse transcriptase n=1 Tax=Hamiltosporidium tvaerminnensis TaxID=1176355 RepID=A0A4Q9M3Z3_9MICR|nr:reverse transcriptase [Hamiltosporidium tvaerminnensis]